MGEHCWHDGGWEMLDSDPTTIMNRSFSNDNLVVTVS